MDVVLVNIPVDSTKKPYDDAFPFSRTINFGLLAIASYLASRDCQVSVFDLQVARTQHPVDELLDHIRRENPIVVGLSCISGFGYTSFMRIASAIRKEFPRTLIIAGGQSHIGALAETVLRECPAVDLVVRGEGEQATLEILQNQRNGTGFSHIPNVVYRNPSGELVKTPKDDSAILDTIPRLDHSLYPDFRRFSPAVEVGRGCPYACEFCSSGRTRLRHKPVSDIVAEVESILSVYGADFMSIYFEAPVFLLDDSRLVELAHLRAEHDLSFTWRAETRVEYLLPDRIKLLTSAGMRVVDVGLESGSPELLVSMNMTGNPSQYLGTASSALRIAREQGLLAKLNLLFYAGENVPTLRQTLRFLDGNSRNVESLSAYPLFLYPGTHRQEVLDDISKAGGSLVETAEWASRHLCPVDPSHDFTYSELQDIGITLGKSYQTMRSFFINKSHGYFCPGTTYREFEECVRSLGVDRLPFSLNEKEMQQARQELAKLLSLKAERRR
jgi:radical SAM superfamily enzyme YgiQ (UPF0313 family)